MEKEKKKVTNLPYCNRMIIFLSIQQTYIIFLSTILKTYLPGRVSEILSRSKSSVVASCRPSDICISLVRLGTVIKSAHYPSSYAKQMNRQIYAHVYFCIVFFNIFSHLATRKPPRGKRVERSKSEREYLTRSETTMNRLLANCSN